MCLGKILETLVGFCQENVPKNADILVFIVSAVKKFFTGPFKKILGSAPYFMWVRSVLESGQPNPDCLYILTKNKYIHV